MQRCFVNSSMQCKCKGFYCKELVDIDSLLLHSQGIVSYALGGWCYVFGQYLCSTRLMFSNFLLFSPLTLLVSEHALGEQAHTHDQQIKKGQIIKVNLIHNCSCPFLLHTHTYTHLYHNVMCPKPARNDFWIVC